MKKQLAYTFTLLTFALCTVTLIACSPVDSVRVFDNEQAARVLQQNYKPHPTKSKIAINLPHARTWKKIDLSFGTVGSPLMLVPEQQDLSHWTESVRTKIVDYYHFPDMTANHLAELQIENAKTYCAKVSGVIIENTAAYSLYQLTLSQCRNEKDQWQIGKAFNGKDGVYLVFYSAVTGLVGDAERESMAAAIRKAELD